MKLEWNTEDERYSLELGRRELELLRRAVERASYLDTPADEQTAITQFCEDLMEWIERFTPGRSA